MDTAPTKTAATGTRRDRVVDAILRSAIWSARRLPYETRVPLFGALASRLVLAIPRFRQRMDENLSLVFPDMAPADRRSLARASADAIARLTIENYSGRELAARMASVTPRGPGLATLDAARASGRPALLLTGHFGNYEAARACLIAHGYRIGGLYRPLANPFFNAHYVATMETIGGPVFPQGREGTKGLLTFLRGGGFAMLLNDLYVGSGIELPFLGHPAMTATSAAEIALRLNAALVPVYGIRQPDGLSFDVVVEDEIPHSDAETMTRAYNASIERRIRDHPGQWYWVHRRWKRKWRGGAGAAEDLHPAMRPRKQARL